MTTAERIHNPGKQRAPYWADEEFDGRMVATFFCPNGHRIKLREHSFSATGVVSPEVECDFVHPDTKDECGFKDKVTLKDWPHGKSTP